MNDEQLHDVVGGTPGGESYAGALRERMDRLLANDHSTPRDIATLMRSILAARKLDLMDRQIRILEQKLGGTAGTIADLVGEAERRAIERETDG